jgi:RNA polymerase primary sigma factor
LDQLTPREADILRKFFGIGVPEKTLEEIGIEFNLTRERVRQIKEKAIRKLKTSSRSGVLKTYLG